MQEGSLTFASDPNTGLPGSWGWRVLTRWPAGVGGPEAFREGSEGPSWPQGSIKMKSVGAKEGTHLNVCV